MTTYKLTYRGRRGHNAPLPVEGLLHPLYPGEPVEVSDATTRAVGYRSVNDYLRRVVDRLNQNRPKDDPLVTIEHVPETKTGGAKPPSKQAAAKALKEQRAAEQERAARGTMEIMPETPEGGK